MQSKIPIKQIDLNCFNNNINNNTSINNIKERSATFDGKLDEYSFQIKEIMTLSLLGKERLSRNIFSC